MLPVNSNWMNDISGDNRTPRLTAGRLRLLEKTTVLNASEKVEVLLIFLKRKWIGEALISVEAFKSEQPHRDLAMAGQILDRLGIVHRPDFYESDKNGKITWLQIASNQAIIDYVMNRREKLTPLEAGVLYGYPTSHCLAFMELLKARSDHSSELAQWALAGAYSVPCYRAERVFFHDMWQEITKASPAIAREVAEYKKLRTNTSHDAPLASRVL